MYLSFSLHAEAYDSVVDRVTGLDVIESAAEASPPHNSFPNLSLLQWNKHITKPKALENWLDNMTIKLDYSA